MARKQQQPAVQIDDLHPINDGFVHSYKGTAVARGVIAYVYLDTVEPGHWRPGLYRPRAYELTFSYDRISKRGRMAPSDLEDIGFELIDHLKERMLANMRAAGWQVVDKTNEGRDIWQHNPPAVQMEAKKTAEAKREVGSVRSQTRVVHTRSITFICEQCGREVTEQRFPSHTPLYCSPACKKEANRVKTRARVAKYRQLHPDARKKSNAF